MISFFSNSIFLNNVKTKTQKTIFKKIEEKCFFSFYYFIITVEMNSYTGVSDAITYYFSDVNLTTWLRNDVIGFPLPYLIFLPYNRLLKTLKNIANSVRHVTSD